MFKLVYNVANLRLQVISVDPVLLLPLIHASTYRDINEQLLVCSSKFIKNIVESEGFTYVEKEKTREN